MPHNPSSTTEAAHNALYIRYNGFPDDLSYEDFLGLDDTTREEIVRRNRVVNTDTYNRSMANAKGEEWSKQETYVLQLRTAKRGYLITSGLRRQFEKILRLPITENEVMFANAFYKNHAKVPYFNRDMWDMVLQNNGVVPMTIDSIPEGTVILPGDPLLRAEGPGELVAHFEPDFHRVFYPTLVATDAHYIAETIGAHRFFEFGKRGTATEEVHMIMVRSMYEGGGISATSNDAAVAAYPEQLRDVGTLGHRFLQFKDTEEAAFRAAIERSNVTALLIDLTDSYRGIDLACRLKEEYRDTGKKIWLRLDSGDLKAQGKYALRKFLAMGFLDPKLDKVIIEDLKSVEDMLEIDESFKADGLDAWDFIGYGGGSLLTTKGKSRGDASSGFKLSAVGDEPKMKFSNTAEKQSLPGRPTLYRFPDQTRIIGQVGEYEAQGGVNLMTPAFRPESGIVLPSLIMQNRLQVDRTFAEMKPMIGTRTPLSPQTKELGRTLRAHYDLPPLAEE